MQSLRRLRSFYIPSRELGNITRHISVCRPAMAPPQAALDFLDFVNASPTPYHAVATAIKDLEAAGFKLIKERDNWSSDLSPGGKYYLTRNASSIVAFAVGKKWAPGNPIGMIGAHTDSPCLRIKPVSKRSGAGFLQVGVEAYGGGIWHTWFDRDLGVAGRLMIKDGKGNFVQKLIKIDKPVLRIPTLAIHLDRASSFDPNKETELFPVLGMAAAELNRTKKSSTDAKKSEDDSENKDFAPLAAMTDRHHPYLIEMVAAEAKAKASDIIDFELVLFDTQKSCIGGINDDFIFSPRQDNLVMTYCSVTGLIHSTSAKDALDEETGIRLISCFDHEEIGSTSAHGANSNLLPTIIRRLSLLPAASTGSVSNTSSYDVVSDPSDEPSTAYEQTLSTSFLLSADAAHSVNPNYAGKYEPSHSPEMNQGPVIKINANQRYATNSPGIVLIQELAKTAGVPLQLFVVRNDSPCGSTIGPMLSAKMGVRTLDMGNPQLSMHSIRETGGARDVQYAIDLFAAFLKGYSRLESKILVD